MLIRVGLMYIISGLFLWLESLVAHANPRIRNLDTEIPDAIPDGSVEAEEALERQPGLALASSE